MENKLWFENPATTWNEALPLGNGKLGAMIFGRYGKERIQLNEDSLWSEGFIDRVNPLAKDSYQKIRELIAQGNLTEAEKKVQTELFPTMPHMSHYETAGDVWLDFGNTGKSIHTNEQGIKYIEETPPEVTGYQRALNLDTGIFTSNYHLNNKAYGVEAFVSEANNVIAYKLTGEINHCFISYTRKDPRHGIGASYLSSLDSCIDSNEVTDKMLIGTITATGHNGAENGIDFAVKIQVKTDKGRLTSNGGGIIVQDATEILLYITIETSYRSINPVKACQKTLSTLKEQSYKEVKQAEIIAQGALYHRFQLNLEPTTQTNLPTDKRIAQVQEGNFDSGLLELYVNYARYLLISSSLNDSLPSNLQGLWNEELAPAWGSKYTININTQMNYWIAGKTGLTECMQPLLNHLKKMHPKGVAVAKEMYGIEGFVCHHNTDIWGDCAPQDNNMMATIWPVGGAWLFLSIWEYYQYTNDQVILAEYYPLLKDAVCFFIEYLFLDNHGHYVTGPSVSPENIYVLPSNEFGSICNDPKMDSQIIWDLFQVFCKVSHLLERDESLRKRVTDMLTKMVPVEITSDLRIMEWGQEFTELDAGHRHISQLYGFYPSNQITYENKNERAAVENTIAKRLENGGGHTGWSRAWIINFFAKLRRPEKMKENIQLLFQQSTYGNLLDKHPPFQIDGNFGGASGMIAAFIQDEKDKVILLPACFDEVNTGEIKGFNSINGVTISFTWRMGQVQEVEIKALHATKFSLINHVKQTIQEIILEENEVLSLEG